MGDLAGKIIEGIIKEVASGDFDVNKLLNMGVPVKTYTTSGGPTNQMMQRQYGASGGTVNGAKGGSNSGSGTASAAQVLSGTAPVAGAANNKTFATSKSQGSKNGKAASADNNSQSVTKMHPTAASNADTIQPILQEEKDGPGFKLKLDDQSLLNGFVLSEILGKPKYLRRERW